MRVLIIFISFYFIGFAQKDSFVRIGGNGHDLINDFKVDNELNVYLTGFFQGRFLNLKAKGDSDGFLIKLNSDNTIEWARQIGSTQKAKNEVSEYGKVVHLDHEGNIYVAGLFCDTIEQKNNLSGLRSNGKQDVFIAKYNSSGEGLWIQSIGNKNNDYLIDFFLDANGNSYVALSYDKIVGHINTKNALCKLDSSGKLLWYKDIVDVSHFKNKEYIKLKNKSIHIINNSQNHSELVSLDLNGTEISRKHLSSKNVLTFDVDEGYNIYFLEQTSVNLQNLVKKTPLNRELWRYENNIGDHYFYRIAIDADNVVLYSGNNSETVSKKISSLVSLNKNNGNVSSSIELSGTFQNKITKFELIDNQLYTSGNFYKSASIARNNMKSVGRTDGFLARQSISKYINYNSLESQSSLKLIYPNPNNGVFRISGNLIFDKLKIYDSAGRLIYEGKNSNSNSFRIQGLESSTYDVQFYRNDELIEVLKMIVL